MKNLKLKSARVAKDLTQQGLADAIGVSRQTISAIEKGFKQATKSWGEDLPDICQKTLEETKKKMNDWKNGVTTAADYSDYLS